jgi:uncharacterized membrane protein
MRRTYILGTFLIFLSFGLCFAQIHYFSEKIEEFLVKIEINKDGSIFIKESILYDFGQELRHGIYRTIPLKGIKIKVLEVVDEFNNPYPFQLIKDNESLTIKIGDPNKTLSGRHKYNISYQVFNAIGFLEDHDELYWNVTGNKWQIPIEKAEAEVLLPEGISRENLKIECFTGIFGSKEKNCQFLVKENDKVWFGVNKSLNPREGLTIALGWPKGIIKRPSFFQRILLLMINFWPLLVPIFAFIYLFQEWLRKGKDPKIKKPIIAEYTPPDDLKPAEVSFILNQKVQPRDLSATIIDLAVRGFLKIREIKGEGILKTKDYEIEKLKDDGELSDYEKTFFKRLFKEENKVRISSLKNKFAEDFEIISIEIADSITKRKYFVESPYKIIKRLAIFGFLIAFIMFFLAGFTKNSLCIVSGAITWVLFLIFLFVMPKRTEKGANTYWMILGFKEYIQSAEKYRAQFYEKENIFEKYLPYAMIFGLTEKWAKAFEGIYQKPPSWYEGEFGLTFGVGAFSVSLNNCFSSLTNSFSSRRGGGGGFSGGGSGGGGGGSW